MFRFARKFYLFFVVAVLITGSFLVFKKSIEAPVPVLEMGQYKDMVKISTPKVGEEVASPIEIRGEARGTWFFEASFPVYVVDWDGKIIGQGIATAQSEWMTENYVPFTASIDFKVSEISGNYSNRGTIIFKKDNPSGLPQFDDAYEMPVLLK